MPDRLIESRRGTLAAVGRWSARRPRLAFVALVIGALWLTGTKTLQNDAVGAFATATMTRPIAAARRRQPSAEAFSLAPLNIP